MRATYNPFGRADRRCVASPVIMRYSDFLKNAFLPKYDIISPEISQYELKTGDERSKQLRHKQTKFSQFIK
jgi:hypothetical protein